MTVQDDSGARYASYLLRLRLMGNRDQANWIASVENTATGNRRSFPSVEALAAFLLAEFGERRSASGDGPQDEGPLQAREE